MAVFLSAICQIVLEVGEVLMLPVDKAVADIQSLELLGSECQLVRFDIVRHGLIVGIFGHGEIPWPLAVP